MDYTTPHTCEHCSSFLLGLFDSDDDPNLHLGVKFGMRPRNSNLKKINRSFFLKVSETDLSRFVSDDCLFYTFISTGLQDLSGTGSGGVDKFAFDGINIQLADDAIEIWGCYRRWYGGRLQEYKNFLHKCTFSVFTDTASPAASEFKSVASTSITTSESFARVQNWLEDCVQNHPRCSRPSESFAPTRLLKIWTHQNRRLIQLVDSDGAATRYAALSYCWGGEQNLQTTSQNLICHQTGFNFQDLPQTLKDAVIVTENIGLGYLWVDALCIVQDDDEDRGREIDLMGHVYESAAVTIIASRAQRAQDGFLQNLITYGTAQEDWVFKLQYRDLGGRISPLVIAPKYRSGLNYVRERAWAFQERLFSYRILSYDSACVHWSCQTQVDCDRQGGKHQFPSWSLGEAKLFHGLRDDSKANNWTTWYRLVNEFSKMKLSMAEDRLPAIAGIAERFGVMFEDEYLAGIWRSSLPSSLLWFNIGWNGEGYMPRPSPPLAPSWSWASTSQPIINSRYVGYGVAKVEIIKIDIGFQGRGSTYGKVTYGHLTLRGFLTQVCWSLPMLENSRDDDGEITRNYSSRYVHVDLSIYIYRDTEMKDLKAEYGDKMMVYLLVLVSNDDATDVGGLILHRHSEGVYSRLGMFNIPYGPGVLEKYPDMIREFLEGRPEVVTIV